MQKKQKLIIISGPTATGKTELAIQIALKCSCEIISADSKQVYKHMDIGTAKPTTLQQELVSHHMIDVVYPHEEFNATIFLTQAKEAVESISRNNKNVIVCGGTGLYIKALTKGLFLGPAQDQDIRKELRKLANTHGKAYLHGELANVDPESAAVIEKNDVVRVVRALEVYKLSGIPISQFHRNHSFRDSFFDTLKIGLFIERNHLSKRIEERVEHMMDMGFYNEVEALLDMGYTENLKPLKGFGYRQLIRSIQGNAPLNVAIEDIKRDTKKYAKRQMTWFRSDKEIIWFSYPYPLREIYSLIEAFLM